jgi:hypothetical protein
MTFREYKQTVTAHLMGECGMDALDAVDLAGSIALMVHDANPFGSQDNFDRATAIAAISALTKLVKEHDAQREATDVARAAEAQQLRDEQIAEIAMERR